MIEFENLRMCYRIRDVLKGRKDAGQIDKAQFDEVQTIVEGEEDA